MRSIPAAVALTMLALVGAAVADLICIGIGHSLAGATGSFVGGIVGLVAALAVLTLRAYPEPSSRPMHRLLIMAVLLTPVLPLIETSWVWARHGGRPRTSSAGTSRPRDVVAEAWRLLNDGDALGAAAVIWEARSEAIAEHDARKLERLDLFVSRAHEHLDGERLERFDAIVSGHASALPWLEGPKPAAEREAESLDMSPLGFWLGVAGSVAVGIAVFLPEASSSSFAYIVHNTLIQNTDGWYFIVLALANLAAIYRARATRRATSGVLLVGAIIIGLAVYDGSAGAALRLCSVIDPTNCERASPGVGLYLAGVGGLLMVFGGWQLRKAAPATSTATAAAVSVTSGVSTVSSTRAGDTTQEATFCPRCGRAFSGDDRFCSGCGGERPQVAAVPAEP